MRNETEANSSDAWRIQIAGMLEYARLLAQVTGWR